MNREQKIKEYDRRHALIQKKMAMKQPVCTSGADMEELIGEDPPPIAKKRIYKKPFVVRQLEKQLGNEPKSKPQNVSDDDWVVNDTYDAINKSIEKYGFWGWYIRDMIKTGLFYIGMAALCGGLLYLSYMLLFS
jgi:hypothetical protein